MDENIPRCELEKKPDNKVIALLKRFDLWLGTLVFGRFNRRVNVDGAASFKGDLSIKVIRANPTLKTTIMDYIRGFK